MSRIILHRLIDVCYLFSCELLNISPRKSIKIFYKGGLDRSRCQWAAGAVLFFRRWRVTEQVAKSFTGSAEGSRRCGASVYGASCQLVHPVQADSLHFKELHTDSASAANLNSAKSWRAGGPTWTVGFLSFSLSSLWPLQTLFSPFIRSTSGLS